jgi:transposase-like protein
LRVVEREDHRVILIEICSRNSGRRSTVVDTTMDGLAWLRKQVEQADTDLLREMVKLFCERLMAEEADAICGAPYGERSEDRTNRRNGYRARCWDTRTGTIDLAIPKLREGSYFPDWLLEPRRRAERAFVQVVVESYVRGVSTRRVEGLVRQLGIERISKSRVSQMAKELDSAVEAFRTRPLEGAPYTYLWLDAITQKVREGGPDRQRGGGRRDRGQHRRSPGDPGS